MKILVCIKQVLDRETIIKIDESGRWIRPDGPARYWLNHYDEFAVEEAVRIKEAAPGARVEVLTVGPERVAAILERAVGMGADQGIHLRAENEGYVSPLVTAAVIAAYVREHPCDLILTGVMSEDEGHGQVGPMLAEMLALSWATAVILAEVRPESSTVYVEREIEGGEREALELTLPALLAIQSGINRPRYPSLSNLLRAKKREFETVGVESLQPPAGREQILGLGYPQKSRTGLFLEGTPREKAVRLLNILREKSLW